MSTVGTLHVRNVPEELVNAFKRRAKQNGRSLNAEIVAALGATAEEEERRRRGSRSGSRSCARSSPCRRTHLTPSSSSAEGGTSVRARSSAVRAVFDANVVVRALLDEDDEAAGWVARVDDGGFRASAPDLIFAEVGQALLGYLKSGVLELRHSARSSRLPPRFASGCPSDTGPRCHGRPRPRGNGS